MYLFSNSIGHFIFDEKGNWVEEILCQDTNPAYKESLQKLESKYKSLKAIPPEKAPFALSHLHNSRYYSLFRESNKEFSAQALRDSVGTDSLLVQTVSAIEEIDKVTNLLTKRLREWHALTLPEIGELISNHEHFTQLVAQHSRQELIDQKKITKTLGAPLLDIDLAQIILLASQISNLYTLRQQYEFYLKETMKTHCPNLLELAGATIGAKLIVMAKGLKNLALLPASTIQLFGAEKALFRHIATGARSPKYGIIINHPLVQNTKKDDKGKAARLLADKLSLCARLDYFKGEFKAPAFKAELEEKFKHE
ncbi:NOP58 family protein [Candidatus Woesearchaeota archaeon]|nr:NOP58 family protein [Candidatus Woesearchaeota archaeon]